MAALRRAQALSRGPAGKCLNLFTQRRKARKEFRAIHAWLIDPVLETLEVFRLESGRWVVLGVYTKSARVHAESFSDLDLNLGLLWLEPGP